ncbi:MAG: hypothetical protein IPI49_08750 [Myxococcales bacterium]|nr:hypothetical protein [Myxococcales bacterium]HRC55033.1 hypothetical protein [Kofleriaceae bacterium]
MGIAERRATLDFQARALPGLKDQIHKLAGFPVELEINWDQLAKEGAAERYLEGWRKVYFTPVIEALKSVGRDDMGREALRDGLKKISFANSADKYSADSAISFVSGELVIDHDPDCNVDYVSERSEVVRKVLEKGL